MFFRRNCIFIGICDKVAEENNNKTNALDIIIILDKKSYHMFKHVIIGGVMKLIGIEASTN